MELLDRPAILLHEFVHVERGRRTHISMVDVVAAQLEEHVRSSDVWKHLLEDVGEVEYPHDPYVHTELFFATVSREVFLGVLAEMCDKRFGAVILGDLLAPLIQSGFDVFVVHLAPHSLFFSQS